MNILKLELKIIVSIPRIVNCRNDDGIHTISAAIIRQRLLQIPGDSSSTVVELVPPDQFTSRAKESYGTVSEIDTGALVIGQKSLHK